MIDVTKNGAVRDLKKLQGVADKAKTETKPKTKLPELSILQKVHNDPKFTVVRSVDWFKRKIQDNDGNSPSAKYDLLKTTKDLQTNRVLPGCMYIFKYMPKHADTLEYFDQWPCSIMFDLTPTGMLGLNLHYLSIPVRAKLFDKIWQIAMVYRNNQQQVKRLTWKFLGNVSKFPECRVAIKQYLYSHLQSKLIKIDIDDWKTALLLPIASFTKKSQSFVERDSNLKIRKIIANPPKPRQK